MSIGYACLCVGLPGAGFRTCTQKNLSEALLLDLIANNLSVLEKIVDYNIQNRIGLFRISSDLIPFGSSPLNKLSWQEIFAGALRSVGEKIRKSGMRVSMHPGQYTILNALDASVVSRAVEDLRYHCRVLDCLGTDASHKLILHVGGVYGDKKEALRRFASVYRALDDGVRRRLVIENDDKCYSIADVLELGTAMGIPVVYDTLHNAVNPCGASGDDYSWISACRDTWRPEDGPQKIHYSQQEPRKKPGSHSSTIRSKEFLEFYGALPKAKPDVMLEVKDKNLSAVKCLNCTAEPGKLSYLEREWGRYKYKVLENAPEIYLELRQLLKDKASYPAERFYELLEAALDREPAAGGRVNAALHVWGYFKDRADDKEKSRFFSRLEAMKRGAVSASAVKRTLLGLAEKYEEHYLLDSLYFFI